ncbi:MAG: DUF7064 domain-containing protein [Sporichthyaceae bacterium]
MTVATQPGSTDLLLPSADPGCSLDPYAVHTYYFGVSVPDAGIGVFVYLRAQPGFPLCQGGLVAFRGLDNTVLLDAEYHDYRATMPWPEITDTATGRVFTTVNGLVITVLEPGHLFRVQYRSPDGETVLDVEQRAISPLVARGHIVPGEEDHHGSTTHTPGGIEQFMHASGRLVLRGQEYPVDCLAVRDRSWNQIRTEPPGGAKRTPPIGWTPISFGEDFALNVTSVEHPDTNPAWLGTCELAPGAPLHYSGWLSVKGELRAVASVRRDVTDYHPSQFAALKQRVEIVDDAGEVHRFTGEAIAMAPMHSWPNIAFHDSVYRWTDEHGRSTHCTYQEIWYDDYQRARNAARRATR